MDDNEPVDENVDATTGGELQETESAVDDDASLPGLRYVAIGYVILTAAALVLLFAAIVTAPIAERLYGVLLGAHAVYIYCIVAGAFALQWAWLRNSQAYADSTGQERPADDAQHDRWSRVVFLLLFLAAAAAFNGSFRGDRHFGLAPGHDQPQYFAYLHSWVFDQDIDFENELKAIPGVWELMANAHPERPEHNVAPIGSPVLWLPFYLAAHGLLSTLDVWEPDGISAPYATAAAFGSMVLALGGLLLTHAALRKFFSHRAAFFAVLLLAVGSPLMWYVIDQPLMSHAASFFAGALVFYLWSAWRATGSYYRYAALGAAIGLAMLVRPSHVALLILPLMDWVRYTLVTAKFELEKEDDAPDELPRFARALIQIGVLLGVMVVVFSPQLITWYLRYGFTNPPGSEMQYFNPNFFGVLYSAQAGLFAWHPIVYAGFIGVPLVWRRNPAICVGLAAVLILYTFLNGSISAWWAGGSFGMRRFVGTLPFTAPGIAALGIVVVNAIRRKPTVLIWATACLLLAWNAVLTIGMRDGTISFFQPKTFEEVWQAASVIVHDRIGNPASYPANLAFGARHGVTPGRYDYLSGFRQEDFLGAVPPKAGPDFDPADSKLLRGIIVKRFLGRGWYDTIPESFRHQADWCAYSRRPELLLPLRKGWTYDMELAVKPPPYVNGPQLVQFYLNGKQISNVVELDPNTVSHLRLELPQDATRNGVNVLALELALAVERPNRNDRATWPGTGLPIESWKPHVETLYLRGFRVLPK